MSTIGVICHPGKGAAIIAQTGREEFDSFSPLLSLCLKDQTICPSQI